MFFFDINILFLLAELSINNWFKVLLFYNTNTCMHIHVLARLYLLCDSRNAEPKMRQIRTENEQNISELWLLEGGTQFSDWFVGWLVRSPRSLMDM